MYSLSQWRPLISTDDLGASSQPAMLVVGAGGDVARIFAGGLPTQAELRSAIDEAASAP